MVKVAPSLLSANFTCLKDDIEKVENGKVFTIEGNSKNEVREKSYNLSSKSIYGYGV